MTPRTPVSAGYPADKDRPVFSTDLLNQTAVLEDYLSYTVFETGDQAWLVTLCGRLAHNPSMALFGVAPHDTSWNTIACFLAPAASTWNEIATLLPLSLALSTQAARTVGPDVGYRTTEN